MMWCVLTSVCSDKLHVVWKTNMMHILLIFMTCCIFIERKALFSNCYIKSYTSLFNAVYVWVINLNIFWKDTMADPLNVSLGQCTIWDFDDYFRVCRWMQNVVKITPNWLNQSKNDIVLSTEKYSFGWDMQFVVTNTNMV